jgi:hypothetical protein
MQRQGVTIDVVNATDALKQDRFGILLIDAFLRSVNPKGYRRRMQVFSPDVLGGARQ